MSTQLQFPGESFFVRNATGLVRELSAFHAFAFNASFINIGLMLIFMFLYAPSFHPGSNMVLATLAATVLAIPMGFVNGMLASIFPRSGGEYVYNSRVISPAVGFAANFNISVWLMFYVGVSCVLFAQHGVAATLRFVGVKWDWGASIAAATWVAMPIGSFCIGTITLIGILVMLIFGTRRMAQAQTIYFVLGLVGVACAVGLLTGLRSDEYEHLFDDYFTKAVSNQATLSNSVTEASAKGYTSGEFSLMNTALIFFWPANFLFWGNCSTYFGGEVQYARRSQIFANVGAIVLSGLTVALAVAVYNRTVGVERIGAITYLQSAGAGFGFAPTYAELAAAVAPSWIGLFVLIACAYWPISFAPLIIGACTRNFLAWSMDRVAPEVFSRVSPRFHTPIPALIACGVVGEISVVLYAFVPAFAFAVGIVGAFITFMVTALSATILPMRRKEILQRSPVNWRIAGYPVITLVGALALIGLAAVQISVLSDPFSGVSLFPSTDAGNGPVIPFIMLLVNLAILATGFLVYGLARRVKKAQGIDLSLAFKEIPPE